MLTYYNSLTLKGVFMASIMRINEFLTSLDAITLWQGDYAKPQLETNRKAINALVKKEMNYLRKHYALTSLRRARSDYRNAIRAHYKGKPLALTYTDKDLNNEKVHIAVKYFVLKKIEVAAYNESEIVRTNDFLSGNRLIISGVNDFVSRATALLESDKYYELFAGLLAVTGRRPIEIAKLGNFEIIDHDHLFFTGQAKTKNRNSAIEGYKIPTLCNSTLIIQAFNRLRTLKDFTDKSERDINAIISNSLGKAVKKHFLGFIKTSPNQRIDNLVDYPFFEAKMLRPIATHIAQSKHAPLSDLHHFAKHFLGHALDKTASNYMEFMLNPNG